MPQQAEEPKYVGCPWCTRGHMPTWRYDINLPDGGEYIHVVREKIGEGAETVTSTVCQAWRPTNAKPTPSSD